MKKPKIGSLAWGAETNGALSAHEKRKMIVNLAFVQVREFADSICHSIGLLRPLPVSLDELMPRETPLVRDSLCLAQETHDEALLFHSWRTYFLGRLIAKHEKLDHDPDLFFASAILHDIALTKGHSPNVSACCFAVSGANRARDHLLACGHGTHDANRVGEAISQHLNMYISWRKSAAECYLVSRGAVCDLFGAGRHRIAPESLEELFHSYPRTGVIEALRFETADHFDGSRADFLTRLSGGKAPKTPFYDRLSPKN